MHETQNGNERGGGEEKSMHGFCETPDTVVSIDECFFSSFEYLCLGHLVNRPPTIQPAFSTFVFVFSL